MFRFRFRFRFRFWWKLGKGLGIYRKEGCDVVGMGANLGVKSETKSYAQKGTTKRVSSLCIS